MKLELKLDGECAIEHENSVSLIGVEIYHLIFSSITLRSRKPYRGKKRSDCSW